MKWEWIFIPVFVGITWCKLLNASNHETAVIQIINNYCIHLKNAVPRPSFTAWKLIQWGRDTHICVGNHWLRKWLVALSTPKHYLNQWWNIVYWTINNNISIEIHTFSITNMHLKSSSAKWRPLCLGLNVLRRHVAVCREALTPLNYLNMLMNRSQLAAHHRTNRHEKLSPKVNLPRDIKEIFPKTSMDVFRRNRMRIRLFAAQDVQFA